jgi:hypothetical protein
MEAAVVHNSDQNRSTSKMTTTTSIFPTNEVRITFQRFSSLVELYRMQIQLFFQIKFIISVCFCIETVTIFDLTLPLNLFADVKILYDK